MIGDENSGQDEAPGYVTAIIEMTSAGHSARHIAGVVGVCERTVQRVRARAGIGQKTEPWPEEIRKRAAMMIEDGVPFNEIARTFSGEGGGPHASTIIKWNKQGGL